MPLGTATLETWKHFYREQPGRLDEQLDLLELPVSELEFPWDMQFDADLHSVLLSLPPDTVCFWATEYPGQPGRKPFQFLPRHWVIHPGNALKIAPMQLAPLAENNSAREVHGDATHVCTFESLRSPRLLGPNDRIVKVLDEIWHTFSVQDLDGKELFHVHIDPTPLPAAR